MSFIFDLGEALKTSLRRKGCPVSVEYGPEENERTTWRDQILVVERDPDAADSFTRPDLSTNPKQRLNHVIPLKLTLYAKSSKSSATPFEHEHRATLLMHMVVVAFERIVRLWGFPFDPPTSGKFVPLKDLEASAKPGGAKYELRIALKPAIPDLTWAGDKQPEATLGGVDSMTRVHNGLADDDDNPNTVPAAAATACGD